MIWNYIGIIVSLGSNFILIPFLIAFLDTDMYGLWNVFISLGAISNLFDFGFNSIFSRNVAYCWSGVNELKKEDVVISEKNSKTNYKLMKQVIKTCQIIYSIISSVAFMMLALFGSIYILSISSYLNNNIIILVAWILYALGIFFNLLYGYFDSFLRGIGKIGAVNKIRTFTKIVQMVMTVILLYCGLGIISASIAYIISGLIFRFTCKRIFYQYSNIGEKMQNEPNPTKKEIYNTFTIVWHNAWKEGVVSLSNYISNQATTLLCASFLTLTEVGKYSLAVQLTSAVGQISTALFASYQPSFQEAYTHRNFDYIRKYLSFSMTIYILLFFLGITGIVIVVIPILQYVRPNAIVDIVVLFEIAFYQFILNIEIVIHGI